MSEVIKSLVFALFLVLVVRARRDAGDEARRRAVVLLAVYMAAVTAAAAVLQRHAWPFSSWPIAAGVRSRVVALPLLICVDDGGREHDVDSRAWPVAVEELFAWMDLTWHRLGDGERRGAARYLVEQAELARVRARAGERFGRSLLPAALAAPENNLLHPFLWSRPSSVPPRRFVGLRWYRATWDRLDPGVRSRQLLYELRADP